MGLVVNRPLSDPIGKVFPELESRGASVGHLHLGGPVGTDRVMALRRGEADGFEPHEVLEQVHLVADVSTAVDHLAAGIVVPEDYRFFLGYAGWGKGQLDAEMKEDAWVLRPAESRLIFDTSPRTSGPRPSARWAVITRSTRRCPSIPP